MSKHILFFLSTITLLLLIVTGIKGLSNTEFYSVSGIKDHLNGTFTEETKIKFDKSIPIEKSAINFWSSIQTGIFREGNSGILIGKDNWLFTSEEYDENLKEDQTYENFFKYIIDTDKYFKKNNISLIVAIIPSKSRIYSEKIPRYPLPELILNRYGKAMDQLKEYEITVIDMELLFSKLKDTTRVFYQYDTHWTYEGTKATASLLSEIVEPLKEIYGLDDRDYIINEKLQTPFEGDLLNYVPSFKKDMINSEQEELYRTFEIKDMNPPKLGLFDSPEIPVILLGTSYSFNPQWNFETSLKEELQLDVLNLSIEGKGPFPPMEELIKSEYFKEINAKIIIWEIPERYIPVY